MESRDEQYNLLELAETLTAAEDGYVIGCHGYADVCWRALFRRLWLVDARPAFLRILDLVPLFIFV